MMTLRIAGLAIACIWLTACGSTQTMPPGEPLDTSTSTADRIDTSREEESEYKNTLKWSTASEVDNFGFDVYRSASEDGPFVRLNDSPVPGAGTSDVPIRYEYVDDSIDPTREYFYYIESISMNGVREKFTPTYRAAPKIGAEDPSDPE